MSYGKKAFQISLISLVLMFGTLFVFILTDVRKSNAAYVSSEIISQWGDEVHIDGPLACNNNNSVMVAPDTFNCDIEIDTKSLHRGIYETEVFSANVRLHGIFCRDSLDICGDTTTLRIWTKTKHITKLNKLKISGKEYEWKRYPDFLIATIHTEDLRYDCQFETSFSINGSNGIFASPVGLCSNIEINGNTPNPSFQGAYIPNYRFVKGHTFRAQWNLSHSPDAITNRDDAQEIGAVLLMGVNRYQKVERTLKYSFIFIVLTFAIVLFSEIMLRRYIPLFNYFLIGVAIVLFYTLLLSFVEITTFDCSYLIASFMTVTLIGGYMWKMLSSRKVGITIGFLLAMMYTLCYILLGMSAYALLTGSLMIFVALAALMYATLRIDLLK